jgi:hypothetical protein
LHARGRWRTSSRTLPTRATRPSSPTRVVGRTRVSFWSFRRRECMHTHPPHEKRKQSSRCVSTLLDQLRTLVNASSVPAGTQDCGWWPNSTANLSVHMRVGSAGRQAVPVRTAYANIWSPVLETTTLRPARRRFQRGPRRRTRCSLPAQRRRRQVRRVVRSCRRQRQMDHRARCPLRRRAVQQTRSRRRCPAPRTSTHWARRAALGGPAAAQQWTTTPLA